eukprot:sb/3471372/
MEHHDTRTKNLSGGRPCFGFSNLSVRVLISWPLVTLIPRVKQRDCNGTIYGPYHGSGRLMDQLTKKSGLGVFSTSYSTRSGMAPDLKAGSHVVVPSPSNSMKKSGVFQRATIKGCIKIRKPKKGYKHPHNIITMQNTQSQSDKSPESPKNNDALSDLWKLGFRATPFSHTSREKSRALECVASSH